jgi:hypothetical protein
MASSALRERVDRASARSRWVALAARLTLVLGIAAALAVPSDEDDDGVAATGTVAPTTTVPAAASTTADTAPTATTSVAADVGPGPGSPPPSHAPSTTTTLAAAPSHALTVDVRPEDHRVFVGERAWLSVTVRNDSSTSVWWQAGGCSIPIRGVVAPADIAVDLSPRGTEPPWPETGWNGDRSELADWLANGGNVEPIMWRLNEERYAGHPHGPGCPLDSRPAELGPGEELVGRYAADSRPVPGPLGSNGSYVVHVAFDLWTTPDLTPTPDDTVVASAALTVVDSPAREPSARHAVDAFTSSPVLAAYVESTRPTGNPDLTQEWFTRLYWWDGGWELWVRPKWVGPGHNDLHLRHRP